MYCKECEHFPCGAYQTEYEYEIVSWCPMWYPILKCEVENL